MDLTLLIPLTVALAILLSLFVYIILYQNLFNGGGSKGKNMIIICGPRNSGKTSLFLQLVQPAANNVHVETTLSAEPNTSVYSDMVRQKTYVLHDIPGSLKVRDHYFDTVKDDARCFILVINGQEKDHLSTDMPFMIHVIASAFKKGSKLLFFINRDANSKSTKTMTALNDAFKTCVERFTKDVVDEIQKDESDAIIRNDLLVIANKANLSAEPYNLDFSKIEDFFDIIIAGTNDNGDADNVKRIKLWIDSQL